MSAPSRERGAVGQQQKLVCARVMVQTRRVVLPIFVMPNCYYCARRGFFIFVVFQSRKRTCEDCENNILDKMARHVRASLRGQLIIIRRTARAQLLIIIDCHGVGCVSSSCTCSVHFGQNSGDRMVHPKLRVHILLRGGGGGFLDLS